MFKVGIIGSENSHAMAFSEIFNLSGDYDDIRVVGIWGEDMDESRKIAEKCGVEVMKPEDMLGRVDAVMVTSRNGALHAGYARPFIEAGKPAFVDKPIANDGGEAEALIKSAFEKGVPVMGGSSLKFIKDTTALKTFADEAKAKGELTAGYVHAPVNMDNPYGGFYFYSSHLIEIAMTIFGYDPVAATAVRVENGVSVILEYKGFAINLGYTSGVYHYGGTVVAASGVKSGIIEMGDAYACEVGHFAAMLRKGEMPQNAHDIIKPVYVLNAIEQSYKTGRRVEIAFD